MSDLVTTARTARERLSIGLNALQDPGLPESLQSAAEPIAQAMSMLLQIERTGMLPLTKGGPSALDLVRQALAKLQSQTAESPALFQAMESVAGSLGLVYGLVQRASSAPPPAQSASTSSNPQRLVASPAVAAAPRVVPSQPVPTSSQPVVTPGTRPQVTGAGAASVPRPQPVQPEPAKIQAQPARQGATASVSSAVAAAMQIPAGGNVANAQTMVAGGVRPSNPGSTPPAAKVPSSPPAAAAPAPKANPTAAMGAAALAGAASPAPAAPTPAPPVVASASPAVGSGTPLQRVAAELGAHSATNFYKGLSGNDVVDSGGIFIATYQVPPIGKPLLIRVSLPGGYEFEAKGIVRWTRDSTSSGGDLVPPGFGAQFTEISPEARQLVYRYARNREPLFHDDL